MGMFSWLCKGCKQEINEGEFARICGHAQVYDGYGGSAGKADIDDPAAWHVRCYREASIAEKLDDTPSPSAPNQGMGDARLEFKENYDARAETTYEAVIFVTYYDGNRGQEWQFYMTGYRLEDQIAFQKELEERLERGVQTFSDKSPRRNSVKFKTIEECKNAVEDWVTELPSILGQKYPEAWKKLVIFGAQTNAEGAVHEQLLENINCKET